MHTVTEKRGYITVEAAIVLPIFIIAVLTLAFSMRVVSFQETAVFTAGNEARLLMQSAAVMPVNIAFPGMLEEEIHAELPELENVSVTNFRYRYGEDDLISFNVIIESNTGLPGAITGNYRTKHAFLMRAFSGKDNSLCREERYGEDDIMVCILPTYGEKYHSYDCTFVTPYPFMVEMNENIKEEYDPCRRCRPDRNENVAEVYIFRYGDAYHIKECSSVRKCVVEMKKEDAVAKGYAPCSKCGGEN